MSIKGLSNYWAMMVDGRETAYFVLTEYIDEFQKFWEKDTLDRRIYYFENLFLPRMNHRPLGDFTYEEIMKIIDDIESKPTPSSANKEEPEFYEESTIKGVITPTIARLFYVAEQVGICEDCFWEAGRKFNNDLKYTAVQRAQLPKSIPPKLEKELVKELLSDEKQAGKTMGIMLMFVFGLRNAEACASTFGNIIEKDGDYYLCSHSTVNAKTARIEVGGKTCNMYRIIPIPSVAYDFIQKRKQYIQELIDNGEIVLDPNGRVKSIQQMPIACSSKDFTKPCVSIDLTLEGRRVFHKLNYEYASLYEIKEHISSGGDQAAFGKERCPTAYLFRRNFGEHLRDLGFTDAEIQYMMGHIIESDVRKRNDFSNSDMLKRLTRKMKNRPLLNNSLASVPLESPFNLKKNAFELTCELPCDGNSYLICVESEEYHDQIDVTIQPTSRRKARGTADVSYWTMERPLSNTEEESEVRDVSVLMDYLKGY